MPIQCKGFSACIRHFSRRVRSSAAAVLILAGVPGEKMSSDAVVVRKGVGWGYLPPYLPEPVPQIVTALDPEAGTLALLDPAGAVPAAIALIAGQLCYFDKSTYHFCQLELAFWELGFPFSELGFRFWFMCGKILDRFTTASRVRHGFGLLPSLRVLCITSSVYRLFEIIFPKI